MNEKVVETKICKHCNSSFEITDKDLEFYEKVSPVFGGVKYQIPTPTLCPDCRQQRRLSFRNERKLYKRKCDFSGNSIVSLYSEDKSNKIYENIVWWSDKWDAMDYGRDYDFNRSFFEQFDKLLFDVPRINLHVQNEENSPYSNFESDIKNCYMTIGGHWNENCIYGTYYIRSTDCLDNYWLFDSKLSYENVNCNHLYKSIFLNYSSDCENCILGFDLKGCKNCFGCIGLNNKQYYIFNKEYSENDYKKVLKELDLGNYNNLEKIKKQFFATLEVKRYSHANIVNSENCYGNDIYNSKNCNNGYDLEDSENCTNYFVGGWAKNCYDMASSGLIELSYEFASGGMHAYHNIFSQFCYECKDIFYSDNCHYSSNLFGCIGLKRKEYCILNKQFTKEQYEELVPKIIEHMMKSPLPPLLSGTEWGEFFPSSISPFGYNETVANEYFPLVKKDALKNGFIWSDYEAPFPKVEKIISASKLPDNISDIPDDILNRAVECEVSKKPFRIIKQELEFYRKHNLPIPRRHPDQRHLDRMALRNPRKLYDRKCDKCGIDIKTTYSPGRSEIVYCEGCYNKEIY